MKMVMGQGNPSVDIAGYAGLPMTVRPRCFHRGAGIGLVAPAGQSHERQDKGPSSHCWSPAM